MTSRIVAAEGTFETIDGLRLFERRWMPEANSKAIVIMVHGYAEHSGRYASVAECLAAKGYEVHAFDLRGHGRSEGRRAFVSSFDEYVDDVDHFLQRLGERKTKKPVFIIGHSLGGTITTLFVIKKNPNLAGIVLSGPYLKISSDVSLLQIKLALIIGKVLPRMPVEKRIDSKLVSRDPNLVKSYQTDPLVYRGWMAGREAAEIISAVKRIQEEMELVNLPFIVLHGTSDQLADPEGSKELYRRAGARDKTLKLYHGLYHEVLNEPEKETVIKDLINWLDAHVEGCVVG